MLAATVVGMRIFAFRVAPFDNGTYVLADDRGEALVIDPAQGEREVLEAVRANGLRVVELLNTHGHFDHVHDNAALKRATRARLAIHRLDAYRLGPDAPPTGFPVPPCEVDDLLDEGALAFVRDLELVALHTPGHTEGSTSFHLPHEGILFTGDLLFKGTIGRVDLPGGDARAMERSLTRVAALPPATVVYPGHGAPTSIGAELPWLNGFRFPDAAR